MKEANPFKEKLFNHTIPVSDGLWSRIEAELPASPERKRLPLFLIAFTMLLMVAAGTIFWFAVNNPTIKEQQTPQHNKTIPAEQKPATTPTTLPEASPPTSDVIKPSELNYTEESIAVFSASKFKHDQPISGNISTNQKHNSNLKSATGVAAKFQNNITSPLNNNSNQTHDRTNSANALNVINVEDVTFANNSFSNRYILYSQFISSLPFQEIKLLNSLQSLNDLLSIKPDPSCYKFTGQEGKSNLSIDLFAGPGISPRSFKNTSAESTLYATARNETETSRYAWSAGGRVNLKLNNELAVRLGVTYDQTGDVFDYTDTLATKQSTTIDSFFAADGTFQYAETRTILIFGTLIKKIHNRYHHLDIPLLASYELPMGRGTLMLNMGPVINLMTSYRGQILDSSLAPQHITPGEPNALKAYKNYVGLSLYLGVGALIPVNENISALIEPRFMYRINPVTTDEYPLKEYRHFGGVNLGIRYHFN